MTKSVMISIAEDMVRNAQLLLVALRTEDDPQAY